jgi:CubicO group peptidase (beta-lactamase class C family)
VIEKVTGETYGNFLARRILQPLGMNQTFHEPDVTGSQFARGYTTFALGAPEPTVPEAKGWIGAAGAIYSTPTDLAKWNLALMSGKVLKPESYALMIRARLLKGGRVSEYGCGLGVRLQSSRRVLTHGGAVSGFTASSLMIPSTKSAVIMLCNQDGGLGTMPGQIFSLLLKEPVPSVPKIAGPAAADMTKQMFTSYQKGRVNRDELSEEFNAYLTDEKIAGAAKRLKSYGAVREVEVLTTNERGGMEVTTARLTFKKGTLKTLMYRMPDGKIEQFFVYPE